VRVKFIHRDTFLTKYIVGNRNVEQLQQLNNSKINGKYTQHFISIALHLDTNDWII